MDWDAAEKYFQRKALKRLGGIGVEGVQAELVLIAVFFPLANRFNSGERTEDLYNKMMSVD